MVYEFKMTRSVAFVETDMAGIASAVPAPVTAAVVAVLFAAFGLQALLSAHDEADIVREHAGRTVEQVVRPTGLIAPSGAMKR